MGFACKKVYSERNVGKTLSKGVAQIEGVSEYGVLAVNLDDVGPPNRISVLPSQEALGPSLTLENIAFLNRHDRAFRKYLATGRVMGAMVASGGIRYVMDRPSTARQYTVWEIPGLEPAKVEVMNLLQEAINRDWKA